MKSMFHNLARRSGRRVEISLESLTAYPRRYHCSSEVPSLVHSSRRRDEGIGRRHFPCLPLLSSKRRMIHRIAGASTRDMADLEERIWSTVGTSVKDPVIGKSLKELKWLNRRIAISDDQTIQLLLKLPTLLHPSLGDLKKTVKEAVESVVRQWAEEKGFKEDSANLTRINVEAMATTPVPFMVKNAEDQKDIESRLGPGLTNVTHFLAVYSCKVGQRAESAIKR